MRKSRCDHNVGRGEKEFTATSYDWFGGTKSASLPGLFSKFASSGMFDSSLLCTGQQLFQDRVIHRLDDMEVEPRFLRKPSVLVFPPAG
jgi:hypothetical protein